MSMAFLTHQIIFSLIGAGIVLSICLLLHRQGQTLHWLTRTPQTLTSNLPARAVPIGGLALFIGLTVLTALMPIAPLPLFLGLSLPLLVINLVDDYRGIRASTRLLSQAGWMAMLCWTLGSAIPLNEFLFNWPTPTLLNQIALVIFGMSWMNASNFIDGIDGLCLTLNISALLLLIGVYPFYFPSQFHLFCMPVTVCLALLLAFNFSDQRKIFLGDHGAIFLSTLCLTLLLHGMTPEHAAALYVWGLWLYLIPLYDIIAVVAIRLRDRRHLFSPNLDHLHHQLRRCEWSVATINFRLFTINLAAGSLGLALFLNNIHSWTSLLLWTSGATLFTYWRLQQTPNTTQITKTNHHPPRQPHVESP